MAPPTEPERPARTQEPGKLHVSHQSREQPRPCLSATPVVPSLPFPGWKCKPLAEAFHLPAGCWSSLGAYCRARARARATSRHQAQWGMEEGPSRAPLFPPGSESMIVPGGGAARSWTGLLGAQAGPGPLFPSLHLRSRKFWLTLLEKHLYFWRQPRAPRSLWLLLPGHLPVLFTPTST